MQGWHQVIRVGGLNKQHCQDLALATTATCWFTFLALDSVISIQTESVKCEMRLLTNLLPHAWEPLPLASAPLTKRCFQVKRHALLRVIHWAAGPPRKKLLRMLKAFPKALNKLMQLPMYLQNLKVSQSALAQEQSLNHQRSSVQYWTWNTSLDQQDALTVWSAAKQWLQCYHVNNSLPFKPCFRWYFRCTRKASGLSHYMRRHAIQLPRGKGNFICSCAVLHT